MKVKEVIKAMAPHEQKEIGIYMIEVGGNPEPVFANTPSFVEVGVLSKNKPVEDLEPILVLSAADKKLQLFPTKAWGSPGWYRARVFFTEKGTYEVRLEFTHKEKKITGTFSLTVSSPTYFPHEPY
jgi:hypothetical protein